ncbi:MAG: patatin-like phospholipase family protein [Erysipelotrichaceae bacterium]
MKTALVLAGGGSRGSYQAGVIQALHELNIKIDIVTGTSIGALNGCLVVQNEIDALLDLWNDIDITQVIKGEYPKDFSIESMLTNSNLALHFFRQYKEHSMDNAPLKELIAHYFNEEKFTNSPIDYGLVSVNFPSLKPALIKKSEMLEDGVNYMIASSSCFPAFPIHEFERGRFIDGGYYDNLPVDLALELGATHFIIVDLDCDIIHPHFINYPNMTYLYPKEYIGSILNFDQAQIQKNISLGYHDTLKAYGKLEGHKYSFIPSDNDQLFETFYLKLLSIEASSTLTNYQNNHYAILSTLQEKAHKSNLSVKEVAYLILDELMILCKYDTSTIYEFDIVSKQLLAYFNEELSEPKDTQHLQFIQTIMKRLVGIDQLNSVKLMINMLKYPQYYDDIQQKYIKFDPMIYSLVQFILLLEKELIYEIKM